MLISRIYFAFCLLLVAESRSSRNKFNAIEMDFISDGLHLPDADILALLQENLDVNTGTPDSRDEEIDHYNGIMVRNDVNRRRKVLDGGIVPSPRKGSRPPSSKKKQRNVGTTNTPMTDKNFDKAPFYVDRCERGLIGDNLNITWMKSACMECSCKSTQVLCQRPRCPQLTCENQVHVHDECCPKCSEKLCETDDGRRFAHGAKWHEGDCKYCECRKGTVLCSIEDCQLPSCDKPIKIPGQCCPVCLDTSCLAPNKSRIPAGEVWKQGLCTHCYCAGGEHKCAQETCPYINCTDSHSPEGKCCPRCNAGVQDCSVSAWGEWGECPVQECGGGMRRRYRDVVLPFRNGGNFCPHLSEAQLCPRTPCNILPVCPVTEWTKWSHCTATCGTGLRMRSRARAPTTKATMTSLIDCSKTHFEETTQCYAGVCLSDAAMLGNFHEMAVYNDECYDVTWTEWGECSVGCGIGVKRRQQVLNNDHQTKGHMCHLLEETMRCHGRMCDGSSETMVHCKVSHWSQWSPCSKSCGPKSRKTKYRSVIRKPANGGRSCPQLFITKVCKSKSCHAANPLASTGRCISDDGKRMYREHEHWLPRPCLSCTCVNSEAQCIEITCDVPNCHSPVMIPGLCCAFCTD